MISDPRWGPADTVAAVRQRVLVLRRHIVPARVTVSAVHCAWVWMLTGWQFGKTAP